MASHDIPRRGASEGDSGAAAHPSEGKTTLQATTRNDVARGTQRDAILRRRMFFVSSALSVLTGCPPAGQAPNDPARADPSVAASTPEPSRSASLDPGPVETGSAPIPSLAIPDDVSDEAKAQFERLADRVPTIHAELDAAEKSVPVACNIDDPGCDAAWTKLAAHLAKASDVELDLAADCFGSSSGAKRFEASLAAHRQAIEVRRNHIQAQIDAALSDEAKRARWEALQAKMAVPRPCLEFACRDW